MPGESAGYTTPELLQPGASTPVDYWRPAAWGQGHRKDLIFLTGVEAGSVSPDVCGVAQAGGRQDHAVGAFQWPQGRGDCLVCVGSCVWVQIAHE